MNDQRYREDVNMKKDESSFFELNE